MVKDQSTESDVITNDRTVTVEMTGTDNSGSISKWLITETSDVPTVEQMNNGSSSTITQYTIQSPDDGSKTLYAWVMDAATNINATAEWTILLDTTTFITIDGGNVCTSSNSVTISGTMESGASVTVDCPGASVGTVSTDAGTWTVDITGLGGSHTVTASVTCTIT